MLDTCIHASETVDALDFQSSSFAVTFGILELLQSASSWCIIKRRFFPNNIPFFSFAGVMELVDVADSKSAGGDSVWVRVPPPAPSSETLDTSAFEASSVFFFSCKYAGIFTPVLSAFSPTRSLRCWG